MLEILHGMCHRSVMKIHLYHTILLGGGGFLHCKHHNSLVAAEVLGKVDDLSENLALLDLIRGAYLRMYRAVY